MMFRGVRRRAVACSVDMGFDLRLGWGACGVAGSVRRWVVGV